MQTLRSIFSLRRTSLLASLSALAVVSACASAGTSMTEITAEVNATLDPVPGRFLPGDTVALRFANDPKFDQAVPVDSNGNASFLLIGSVSVAGKRPDELRDVLEQAYKPKLASPPDLTINLIETSPPDTLRPPTRVVYVMGEVHNPGAYPVPGQPFSFIDALARAGGHLKATALLKNVLFVRWLPEKNNWKAWNIDARPDHWGAANQILVQAKDFIYVPNTPIDNVDIWVDQYIRQLIPFPYLIPPGLIFGSSATP
jgi:protein involved in polysaccharide export with SLBB domain